jgi:hypothetical protein
MVRTILAALLAVLAPAPMFSQQPADQGATQTCNFSEAYRKEGWNIPGLRGAKQKETRRAVSNLEGLFVTMLQPAEAETNFEHVWCPDANPAG